MQRLSRDLSKAVENYLSHLTSRNRFNWLVTAGDFERCSPVLLQQSGSSTNHLSLRHPEERAVLVAILFMRASRASSGKQT